MECEGNQLNFRIYFKAKINEFINFIEQMGNKKVGAMSNDALFEFNSDLNRDVVLLAIGESLQKPKYEGFHHVFNLPITARQNIEKGKITAR